MNQVKAQFGVTLIELMIAIAILAVLAGLAAPSFRSIIAAQKVKDNASDLYTDLLLARSEALRRNIPVTISPISSSWSNGWTVATSALTIKTKSIPAGVVSISKVTGTDDTVVFGTNGRTSGSFQLNFTASGVASDSQKRCVKSDSAGGQKILRGVC